MRERLGHELFARVAGPDGARHAERIHRHPGYHHAGKRPDIRQHLHKLEAPAQRHIQPGQRAVGGVHGADHLIESETGLHLKLRVLIDRTLDIFRHADPLPRAFKRCATGLDGPVRAVDQSRNAKNGLDQFLIGFVAGQ